MRIALLTNGIFPYVIGGIQKHSFYLARYLAQRGVQVDLFFAVPQGSEVDVPLEDLFSAQERTNIRLFRVNACQPPYFPGHYILSSYRTSVSLHEALVRARPSPEFIYAQGFAGWKTIKAKRKGLEMPPIGVNFHGLEMYQKYASSLARLKQWMFRPFVTSILREADYVLSLGGGLSRIVHELGVSEDHIIVSPNGVALDWLPETGSSEGETLTFLFVGVYHRRKGLQELQQALAHMPPHYDFRFEFVGGIPDKHRMQLPRVHYLGFVDEEELKAAFLRADVLVCPSYSEGMPTVILEAMAAGSAVIATNVGAVDELVSDRNGWLIPAGDEELLLGTMMDALTLSSDELAAKKDESRRLVRDFYWDAVAERTLDGIKSKLQDPKTPMVATD